MATTTKAFARQAAATTNTILYTVPASTTAVVTNIVIANAAATAATATINLNGTVLLPAVSIGANSVAVFDLKQVLVAAQTISGSASATTVSFHLSGVEIV